jgi:hypothetical protein
MPKGLSLHIGLNAVDPNHYAGWDGQLAACEFDANDMAAIARKQGYNPQVLLTSAATSKTVIGAIRSAAQTLKKGDIFFLSYSGHGGQVPDTNDDETDGKDETWVLFDRQVIDDELYALWSLFAPGVRIIMLSDSCHSGSVLRMLPVFDAIADAGLAPVGPRYRGMPQTISAKTYKNNKALYEHIQDANSKGDKAVIGATVLLISGCQDNQLSSDGDRNGLFTQMLRRTWKNGSFLGSYRTFRQKIAALMPPEQTPVYSKVGAVNHDFERQKPFAI